LASNAGEEFLPAAGRKESLKGVITCVKNKLRYIVFSLTKVEYIVFILALELKKQGMLGLDSKCG